MKPRLMCIILGFAAFSWSVVVMAAPQPARIVWQTDFHRASQLAALQKKPLLVVVSAPWCGACHKMSQETLVDKSVTSLVNASFLPVMLDSDVNGTLAAELGAESLPTTLVLSPDLKILSKREGYQSATQLQATLVRHVPRTAAKPKSFLEKYAGRQ